MNQCPKKGFIKAHSLEIVKFILNQAVRVPIDRLKRACKPHRFVFWNHYKYDERTKKDDPKRDSENNEIKLEERLKLFGCSETSNDEIVINNLQAVSNEEIDFMKSCRYYCELLVQTKIP